MRVRVRVGVIVEVRARVMVRTRVMVRAAMRGEARMGTSIARGMQEVCHVFIGIGLLSRISPL